MKKTIICLLAILLCSCATPTNKMYEFKINTSDFEIPSGILHDDHLYWEVDQEIPKDIGEKIGTLQDAVDESHLPGSELNGTNDLKKYIGDDIYLKNQSLFLKTKDRTLTFQYITKMKLPEKISKPKDENADAMVKPHFVYHDMIYYICNGSEVELPEHYEEVGKVKESLFSARDNFTGNINVGDSLFASNYQNRFMFVKNIDNQKYYMYENEGYKY